MYNRVRGVVPATAGRVAMGYTGERMERGAATAPTAIVRVASARDNNDDREGGEEGDGNAPGMAQR